MQYLTLSVGLQELDGGARYEAIVRGPAGDGRSRFELPFGEEDLHAITAVVSRPRSSRRRIETEQSMQAREFGSRLFELIFQGSARDALVTSMSNALSVDERGLRVMLDLDGAPALRNVPWELLWDKPDFISISAYTPVLRYVTPSLRRPPVAVRSPLRILGMISSPGDVAPLDVEDEKEQLTSACRHLKERGLLEIEWVEEANLSGLLEALKSGTRFHVFHFMGHGDFDEQDEDGVLLFEGPAGRSQRVPGARLGTILRDHHTLRLAVINACEGARTASDSSGVASSLMEYGLPAVIAMQFEISDVAAISFARCFYGSLARGNLIDNALADARLGMFADGHGLEWATPVMFTSVEDGQLFTVDMDSTSIGPVAGEEPQPPADTKPSVAPDGSGGIAERATVTPATATAGLAETPTIHLAPAGTVGKHGSKARLPAEPAPSTNAQARPKAEPSSRPGAQPSDPARLSGSAQRYAGFSRRFWASMIDGFLALLILGSIGAIVEEGHKANQGLAVVLALVGASLYYIGLEGRSGQTVGKRLLGVRVVDAESGGSIGYGRALIRTVGRYLSSIPLCAGYLAMINNPRKQCWHDRLARTVVVSTRDP